MKRLANLAKNNPTLAQGGIFAGTVLLLTGGYFLGKDMQNHSVGVPLWSLMSLAFLGGGISLIAPTAKKWHPKQPRLKNTFANRSIANASLLFTSFVIAFSAGNHSIHKGVPNLVSQLQQIQPLDGGGTEKSLASPTLPEHHSEMAIYGSEAESVAELSDSPSTQPEVESGQSSRKNHFGNTWGRKQKPDASNVGRFFLWLLGAFLAFALSVVLAVAACSVSCGGPSTLLATFLAIGSGVMFLMALLFIGLGIAALLSEPEPKQAPPSEETPQMD